MNENRFQKMNNHEYENGPVVYWMNRDQRMSDNWALIFAQEQALKHKVPLLVVFNLDPGFLGGGYRQHAFKVKGLQELCAALAKKNIPFFLVEESSTETAIVDFLKNIETGLLVTDFFPLRISKKWGEYVRKNISIPMYRVDAHNVIPVWVTSEKQEFAARTIRPKIHRNLDEYLTDFPKIKKHPYSADEKILEHHSSGSNVNWEEILENKKIDKTMSEVDWIGPGEKAALKEMKKFIQEKLGSYSHDRNVATLDGQSNLSAYFHFGQLSPQRVAWEVVQHSGKNVTSILDAQKNGSKDGGMNESAFLEEMIVRRELCDNFCHYNKDYDSVEGFPDWAKKTLHQHTGDDREYLYTKKQFEKGETHDPLWNAAQLEMVHRGKMHGYMRMYWAKKILQWTKSPKEALKIALYLNDKYELDGRDPSGYVGCAWSIGGLHDRPWFDRDVFGTVRYMAESGVAKRFKVEEYIERITSLVNKKK